MRIVVEIDLEKVIIDRSCAVTRREGMSGTC